MQSSRLIQACFFGLCTQAHAQASAPGLAKEANDLERLLLIIKQQQRQLEAQQAQIASQQQALQALRRDVEALRAHRASASAPPAAPGQTTSPPPSPTATGTPGDIPRMMAKATLKAEATAADGAVRAERRVDRPSPGGLLAQPSSGERDWPGAFRLPGTETQMRISGFVELDAIHDTDAITTPTAFVTSAIVTSDKTAAEGADGQTNLSVQASRVVLETKTPIAEHQLKTYVSADWFGDFSSSSPSFHLRQAYGEVGNIFLGGDLLIGQAWSTVTDLDAAPNVLDFQGPNALFGDRRPLLRWSKDLGSALSLKLAAEAPDLRVLEGASSVSRWPDAVVALNWKTHRAELMGTAIARDLRASAGGTGTVETVGWGTSVQGRVQMPRVFGQDFATFAVTYGRGIGGLVNDEPPDASYNIVTGKLEPIPTFAWMATYQHWWSPKLYSVASYGEVEQDTFSFQTPDAFEKTRYASANLTWTPFPQWLLGVEVLYGSRQDKNGADGSDVRTQFTSRFSFP